ncbi:MAG TPA: zf-HC2 domain-containing protein, partial [Candidatus Binatus sp.]|nr:zf-HC2 domain-containing protein [Candidatus Binatus sp.]
MDCPNAQNLLDGYLDGELDALRSSEIEIHLHGCTKCAQSIDERQAIRRGLKSPSLYFKAPDGLQKSIRHSLRQAAKAEAPPRWFNAPWLKFAIPAAAAALVLITLMPLFRGPARDDLAEEAVANHVRSLMVDHLADVASTDEHTVKPWFNGKVNFSPPVSDLAEQGFPLIGGRLDYLDNQPVAALVYRRDKHVINVFVWPSASSRQ